MENWKICNGRKIQQRETHIIIQIDVSTRGRGHTAREFGILGERTGGEWSKKNNYFHINVLKLLALKFAILFSKRICQTWPFMIKWKTKLLWYLLQMGITGNPQLLKISQFGIIRYLIRSQQLQRTLQAGCTGLHQTNPIGNLSEGFSENNHSSESQL